MNKDADTETVAKKPLYILLGLVLLIAGGALLSILAQIYKPQAGQTVTPVVSTVTVDIPQEESQGTISQVTPTIALATPWGVLGLDGSVTEVPETPQPEPLPELAPIVLLGPPAESQFRAGDSVTFYWDWPEQMDDGMHFAVYLQSESGSSHLLGTTEAGNLGLIQQIQVIPGDLIAGPATGYWQVVVEDSETGTILARSESRPIVVLANDNQ